MIELYNEWFTMAVNEVKSMGQSEFDEMVAMYQISLKANFASINEKSSYIQSHIENEDYNFNYVNELIDETKKLKIEEWMEFVD